MIPKRKTGPSVNFWSRKSGLQKSAPIASAHLDLELESGQKRQGHRVKWIVVGRRVELEEHGVAAADDVRHRVAATESNEHAVRRRAPVVDRQVVLHHVALIPDSVMSNDKIVVDFVIVFRPCVYEGEFLHIVKDEYVLYLSSVG